MNNLRVFFAVNPPISLGIQLEKWLKLLEQELSHLNLKWIKGKNLHVTVQFMGTIPVERLAHLTEIIREVVQKNPTFQLQLGHLNWFPSLKQPKVLALTVEPQSMLCELSDSIKTALIQSHYPYEAYPFRAHMSLARLSSKSIIDEQCLVEVNAPIFLPVWIEKIHLMQSKQNKEGSTYHSLAEFELNG